MKRILVTGGAGFVGVNLIDFLLERTDWEIRALDNLSARDFTQLKNIENYDEDRVEPVEGDIRNMEDVEKAVEGCDYVVNLAAQVGVVSSVEDPKHDADVNINGLLNVLEACKEEGVEKVVHASSAAPLGEVEPPVSEKDVPKPLAPYGASKLAGEGYCSAYAGSFDMDTVALRFSNVYGPYSGHKASVIHKFIRRILDGKELVVYGDGEQTRDYIHAEDISRGIYLSLEKKMDGFELVQLGTGKETSVNDLVEALERCCEKYDVEMSPVVNEDARAGEIRRNYTDITKAEEVLGFKPGVCLEEGLEETFGWFMER